MASRAMPSHNGPPAKGSSESPSESLYITNLPDKLHKPDLKMELYMLFTTYGTVLDVVALKTAKMRGQAHVVFRDIQASTQAMRALQGFDFFGKEMKIQYARGRSNVFNRLEGVYKTSKQPAPDAQPSLFAAPLPGKPIDESAAATDDVVTSANGVANVETTQGIKRPREEESDAEEAPMEEDEDDDVSMEASSDDD